MAKTKKKAAPPPPVRYGRSALDRDDIQRVFRRYGPESERLCDWRKCMDEPWKSLADILEGRGI